jgi:hypothetical protein
MRIKGTLRGARGENMMVMTVPICNHVIAVMKSLIMMTKTLLSVDTTLRGDLKSPQENMIYMRMIQRGLQVQGQRLMQDRKTVHPQGPGGKIM